MVNKNNNLSVDPMGDKRSWVSPYAYCQNNPVVLVDPRGMIDDWYMNEETGELYYNKNRSSQTTQHNNKTYTRIGDNNMMGDMGNTTEKSFNYDESISFANEHGYAIVPTQQFYYRFYNIHHVPTGNYDVKTESGYELTINEKYTITNKYFERKLVKMDDLSKNKINFLGILLSGKDIYRKYFEYKPSKENNIEIKKPGSGYAYENYCSWEEYISNPHHKKSLLKYRNKN